jgi:hypothetical protein
LHHICTTSKRRSALSIPASAAVAQVDRGVVTGGRVVGGGDVVTGGRGVAGDTEVLGAFPSPPPLVVASAIATTATIAVTGSHSRRDLSSSTRPVVAASLLRASSTRAPQWEQNVARGVRLQTRANNT